MPYFEITINQHYRHEPYHDVSGYELRVVRNNKELPSYLSKEYHEEELKRSYINAVEKMNFIASELQHSFDLKDIEKFNDESILRIVEWYSIGD